MISECCIKSINRKLIQGEHNPIYCDNCTAVWDVIEHNHGYTH